MGKKVFGIIGLILGVLTVALAVVAGLDYDWGILGLVTGIGLISTNISNLMKNN